MDFYQSSLLETYILRAEFLNFWLSLLVINIMKGLSFMIFITKIHTKINNFAFKYVLRGLNDSSTDLSRKMIYFQLREIEYAIILLDT